MKIVEFEEVNVRFAENQDEYETLPGHYQNNGMFTFCMELNEKEVKRVLSTKSVILTFLNFNAPAQPIIVHSQKP